jgi:hypothetical protein
VNTGQIIPVFTIVCDDKSKSKREKIGLGTTSLTDFPAVLVPFNHLARVHDEATTSDYGGDTGDQLTIVAGADEYDKKTSGEKACCQESAC